MFALIRLEVLGSAIIPASACAPCAFSLPLDQKSKHDTSGRARREADNFLVFRLQSFRLVTGTGGGALPAMGEVKREAKPPQCRAVHIADR